MIIPNLQNQPTEILNPVVLCGVISSFGGKVMIDNNDCNYGSVLQPLHWMDGEECGLNLLTHNFTSRVTCNYDDSAKNPLIQLSSLPPPPPLSSIHLSVHLYLIIKFLTHHHHYHLLLHNYSVIDDGTVGRYRVSKVRASSTSCPDYIP